MLQTICLILTAAFFAWELDREKPIPHVLGGGDTLMIRTSGYGFCPKYCETDHFHLGHYKRYDCEENLCNHITVDEN